MSADTQRRNKPGAAVTIVQTRLIAALGVLLLAQFTIAFDNPARISWIIVAYSAFTLVFLLLPSTALERKRVRAIPELLDLLAISFLVESSGGLESPWFLLYLFPVMSASRFLGPSWSVMLAVVAVVAYGWASSVAHVLTAPATYPFLLRAVVFAGAALTAANLARTRDREEARLVRAIQEIDREILSTSDLGRVMRLILNTAMDLTDSDLSALVLVDAGKIAATFSAARTSLSNPPRTRAANELEAHRVVSLHYRRVLDSRQPLYLPKGNMLAAALSMLRSRDKASHRSARLVPLEIGHTPFGVLGVLSLRRLHYYTPNDLRNLSSMAPLVAIAQKNARLYRELASREAESKSRLLMLYDIAQQLKSDQGRDEVFRNVVKLVSARLGSEEAALFVPDEQATRIEKVAVSGPNSNISERLMAIEVFYESEHSLTKQVFDSKTPRLENCIAPDEDYAKDYSEQLPSGRTRHYIGVPLLIGAEVLGVIRALNKRAKDYSPESGCASLAEEGFTEDDLELLKMIATQVASAIRNAKFIERNRYFRNLVYDSPDAIIVLDRAGRIQNVNKECKKI